MDSIKTYQEKVEALSAVEQATAAKQAATEEWVRTILAASRVSSVREIASYAGCSFATVGRIVRRPA